MSILGRLAILFVVIPIVELAILIRLGQWLGVWPTLSFVLLTGIVGAWLARAEGFRTIVTFQNELAGGRLPRQAMQDGAAVLVGGALLLTPGFLTDLLGFALLFPPTRHMIQRRFRRAMERRIATGQVHVGVFRSGEIEVEGRTPREDDRP